MNYTLKFKRFGDGSPEFYVPVAVLVDATSGDDRAGQVRYGSLTAPKKPDPSRWLFNGLGGWCATSPDDLWVALPLGDDLLKGQPSLEPDYLYDPSDWEKTVNWGYRDALEDHVAPGAAKRFETLVRGPDRFAARIPLSFDEEGDVEDSELRWFATENAALAALAAANAKRPDE